MLFLPLDCNYEVSGLVWHKAEDVKEKALLLVREGRFHWLDLDRIFFVRSYGAKTKALARIWGLPRIWQLVLDTKPSYVIEVIAEKFDKLSKSRQEDVLIHEIAHIPRNFSGSLVPHFRRGKRKFKDLVSDLKLRSRK